MRSTLSLLLTCIITFSVAQTTSFTAIPSSTVASTNGSVVLAPYCYQNCGHTGSCQTNNMCRCYRGFIPSKRPDGGSECVITFLDQGFSGPIIAMRVIFSILYAVQLALVSFRIFLEFFASTPERQGLAPVFVTRAILFLLWIDILIQFLSWAIDFRGIWGTGLPLGMNTLAYIEYPNLVLVFCILLAYWIDFYHALLMKLKREQMLKKLNSSYVGGVSFEDIIMQINRMRRIKIIMAILSSISYAIFIIAIIFVEFSRENQYDQKIFIAFFAWFAFVWLILGVGFLIFGIRLSRLLPAQMAGRIGKLTRKVSAVAIILLIDNLFSFCVNVPSIPGIGLFLVKVGIVAALTVIARFLWIDIHLPFASIKHWGNFTWSRATSSKTTDGTNKSQNDSNNPEGTASQVVIEMQAQSTEV